MLNELVLDKQLIFKLQAENKWRNANKTIK